MSRNPSTAGKATAPRPEASGPPSSPHGINVAVVRGVLSSDPASRELPSGDVVRTYEVTVRSPDGPADTVPVACFGKGRAPTLHSGDEVVVVGRVRRRFFRAGGSTASRTEVLAAAVVPGRQAARASAAIARAVSALTDEE